MEVMDDRASADWDREQPVPALQNAKDALATGDAAAALALYDTLLAADPDHADALAGRGAALRALGRPHDALVSLLEALARDHAHQDAQLDLARALGEAGRHDEARRLYALLTQRPAPPPHVWHGLALLCLSEGHEAVAEACLRRAVAALPGETGARLDLGDLLVRRGELAEAVECFHHVLGIRPGIAAAHAGLAQALIGLGRLAEAGDQLEWALAREPANVVAHLARARLNLMAGNLPAAWGDWEWRWSLPGRARPQPPGLPWDGAADLSGRTLLAWAEQGLAETIHALRYVPPLARRGARVVLGVPPALAPLAAAGLAGVDRVILSGQPLPAGLTIDFHASLADLPRLYGGTLAQVPPAPYLTAPGDRRSPLRAPATALLKVGVAWAGDRPDSSVPLAAMMPLLGLPGIAAYSLQTGPRARDAAELAHPSLMADLSPSMADFADLAARIAEMDVVVAVDGAVAHLAGALRVAVCVLVPRLPDWRWMHEREDSPWYGSARLFRQSRAGNWEQPVQAVCAHLRRRVADARMARDTRAQTAATDTQQARRAFLATHLRPGDLLVDAGAGEGRQTLAALARPDADLRILAIEARPAKAATLAARVAETAAAGTAEVIAAALAARPETAVVAARPRCGRHVLALPAWVRGGTAAIPLDMLLAQRPHLAGRRLVLHLGAAGAEDDILAGLTHSPAVVIFEHRHGSGAATRLRAAGYRLVRFPGAAASGPVVPFDGEAGAVLAVADATMVAALYGDPDDPASPAAMGRAIAHSRDLAAQGNAVLAAGDLNRAGDLYGRALACHPDNAEALATLGSLLRRIGRVDAAAACWTRALANEPAPGVRINLANALRDLGQTAAAEVEFAQALAADPANPLLLHGLGLLERDRGHARQAVALFERAEHLRPGSVPRHHLAVALLKAGNLARGMAELAHRPAGRLAPLPAPAWDGGRLNGRTLLIRDEDRAIDTIMLARFLPHLARQGGQVVVECVPEAARLLAALPGIAQVVPRGQPVQPVDVAAHLLDVPRLIGTTSRTTPLREVPYLHLPAGMAPPDPGSTQSLRVGIAWGGGTGDRGVPLTALLRLAGDPRIRLFSLQRGPRAADLAACGAIPLVEDLGDHCADLADAAACIAGLDVIVAADTVAAHLAGAMGKPVWVLLPAACDWRWVDGREDCIWYPTMRVFRQGPDGCWNSALSRVAAAAHVMAAGKERPAVPPVLRVGAPFAPVS